MVIHHQREIWTKSESRCDQTKKEVKSLLALANCFRALIPNYADTVNPLVKKSNLNGMRIYN